VYSPALIGSGLNSLKAIGRTPSSAAYLFQHDERLFQRQPLALQLVVPYHQLDDVFVLRRTADTRQPRHRAKTFRRSTVQYNYVQYSTVQSAGDLSDAARQSCAVNQLTTRQNAWSTLSALRTQKLMTCMSSWRDSHVSMVMSRGSHRGRHLQGADFRYFLSSDALHPSLDLDHGPLSNLAIRAHYRHEHQRAAQIKYDTLLSNIDQVQRSRHSAASQIQKLPVSANL
jgi:hypothetical protein